MKLYDRKFGPTEDAWVRRCFSIEVAPSYYPDKAVRPAGSNFFADLASGNLRAIGRKDSSQAPFEFIPPEDWPPWQPGTRPEQKPSSAHLQLQLEDSRLTYRNAYRQFWEVRIYDPVGISLSTATRLYYSPLGFSVAEQRAHLLSDLIYGHLIARGESGRGRVTEAIQTAFWGQMWASDIDWDGNALLASGRALFGRIGIRPGIPAEPSTTGAKKNPAILALRLFVWRQFVETERSEWLGIRHAVRERAEALHLGLSETSIGEHVTEIRKWLKNGGVPENTDPDAGE